MEPNSKSIAKVESLLLEIIKMLRDNNSSLWYRRMTKLLDHLRMSDDKREAASLIMRSMLGGMGSLSDLALYRDGNVLPEESTKFQILVDELFEACENFIQNS